MTAANDPQLLRAMARAHYEAGRPKGSSRPPFEGTTTEWQDSAHREMAAAIRAAEGAGWNFSKRSEA